MIGRGAHGEDPRTLTAWLRTVRVWALAIAFTLGALGACARSAPAGAPTDRAWVGTWGTAPQLVEPANMPPAPGLTNNTLRQVMRPSIGGDRLRVRVSNAFGDAPLTINTVRIASSRGGGVIEPANERPITFAGKAGITIAAGDAAISDALDYSLQPLADVAITIAFGDVPRALTGHPGSRTTSYLHAGSTSAVDLSNAVKTVHWYVLTGIDVIAADGAAIVTLGNSITDGRGSGTDLQNRWPDEFARRLHNNAPTRGLAVLNQGIGGNCVLKACLGPSALDRFDRDVLGQSGVRWLIVLEGVNDIGQASGEAGAAAVARGLIEAYRQMIGRAHARGIKVYGATILPFGGSFYDNPAREAARTMVNQWIRTSREFDAVIDTDAALRDPAQPSRLRAEADTGDHLHPNEVGHRMIAEAIDLALFTRALR